MIKAGGIAWWRGEKVRIVALGTQYIEMENMTNGRTKRTKRPAAQIEREDGTSRIVGLTFLTDVPPMRQ
jgi:ferritin-like protein